MTALLVVAAQFSASAQSSQEYSAGNMWGTSPLTVGVPGALDSAIAHNQNSAVAGAVNAAEAGMLINGGPGSSLNITSVGSQSIVSSTIVGNDNNVDIDADQQTSNSGNVDNQGSISSP